MTHFVLDARTATPHFPGIGRYVSNLARALAPLLASGERLTIIHAPAHPLALPAGANVEAVPLAASAFSLSQQWAVPRQLRRLRADLYHGAYVLMPYWPGIPTLLTVYDLIPLRYPAHSTPRARLFIRWMTRFALRAARHVVAISEFTRRDYMTEFHLAPEEITAIPLAADPVFRPQPADPIASVRRKYALPERFVLYVGSNKPHKNLVRLVKAWALARSGLLRPDCSLVIAGAWDARYPEARHLADASRPNVAVAAAQPPASSSQLPSSGSKLSSIVWLGPVPEIDLPALYTAATAFVFPSLYEGFGLPVLEAMACGTPVICSNTSSLPEVAGAPQTLGTSGDSTRSPGAALLVDPTDTEAIAEALSGLLRDAGLRAELRERGLKRARAFTWERTAATTLALYRTTQS